MDDDLLGMWFGIKVLSSDDIFKYYRLTDRDRISSQQESFKFMLALSTYILYWLHESASETPIVSRFSLMWKERESLKP